MNPLLPDYAGACISNLVPALLHPRTAPAWVPPPVAGAKQVVLFVLDGVGWKQLQDRLPLAPMLASMNGGPITSVAPTTTSTALSSIVLGCPPAAHGVLGYRLRVDGSVLNVLRWQMAGNDARQVLQPAEFQSRPAFGGTAPPVVTRAAFADTGFTTCLGISKIQGWKAPSSIAVEVSNALAAGAPFVYAYYDGVDTVAHEHGFGANYDAELTAVDRLVADVAAVLPPGAVLVVTADHGQVEVGERLVLLSDDLLSATIGLSGEARFLWLHARPGAEPDLIAECRQLFERTDQAWVRSRSEIIAEGWFGGPVDDRWQRRLGDVALIARAPVAFLDPTDSGSAGLRCRHGSLTADELLVPLLAVGSG